MLQEAPDMVSIVADAAMRALALHAREARKDGALCLPKLRAIVKAEYPDLVATLAQALEANMGGSVYRHTINVYANAWAVKALANPQTR